MPRQDFNRRRLLQGAGLGAGILGLQGLLPVWAQTGTAGLAAGPVLSGEHIHLSVDHGAYSLEGRTGHAFMVNGVLPSPLIRLKEGQQVHLMVENRLAEDTSIHWHGLLLPFQMDGVPGVSFPGIKPGQTFDYRFGVKQAGTYWYHSHSNMQEAMGMFGPLVIDPAGADPVGYDREHVIVLSDWSWLHPHDILGRLKKSPGYFNQQKTTVAGLLDGTDRMSARERRMWARMRMDPRDLSDVTGSTYTYLVNGHGPQDNWTGLFEPGERVRLRLINASAMSIFNVRIPGLALSVVQADGENIEPVEVDELQISVAETYDVIVQPAADRAYTLVAEASDRSGMARATLAPRLGMEAEVPPLRPVPNLTMRDMGMGAIDHGTMDHGTMDHSAMGHGSAPMDHSASAMRDDSKLPSSVTVGVGVDMIAPNPVDRLGDRPLGLEDVDHRVLVYTDLKSLNPHENQPSPTREMEIHLTGNMERYMWGFDGKKFSEIVEPIRFGLNERVRVTLVNNTMMAHPIHLHGHFFELVNGHGPRQPKKHTVTVAPGGKLSFDLTADAPGDWAFHCHLLMHMHSGMFNVVTVRPMEGGAA